MSFYLVVSIKITDLGSIIFKSARVDQLNPWSESPWLTLPVYVYV